MVTIGNYSISLGLQAGDLIDKSKLARNEIGSLTRTLGSLTTPAERMEKALNLAERGLSDEAKAAGALIDIKERLRLKFLGVADAVDRETEAMRKDNRLISEGESLTRRLMTAEERHAQELRKINELYRQGAIGATTRSRAIADLSKNLAQASAAEQKHTAAQSQNAGSTGKFGSALMMVSSRLFAAGAAFTAVRGSINIAADVERAQADFTSLTGSAQMATNMLGQMRQLANTSPLSFSGVQQAGQTLLSFGMDAQQVMPTLRMMGDITGGNSERFKMLSLAFAQTQAAGRLMGQDLLQMINAGFNPLQEISKTSGRSLVDLKKDMEAGAIGSDMVAAAFKSATSEGGLFKDRMANAGKTTSGAMQQAWSSIEKIGISLGESLAPLTNSLIGLFNELTPALEPVYPLIKTMANGIGLVVSAVSDLIAGAKEFISLFVNMKKDSTQFEFGKNTSAFFDRMEKEQIRSQIANQKLESTLTSQASVMGKQLSTAEAINRETERRNTLQKGVSSAVENVRSQIDVERYGKDAAERLKLGMESMTDAQRKVAERQRYQGAPVEKILSVLDPMAQLEVGRLRTMQRQLEGLQDQKKYTAELAKAEEDRYQKSHMSAEEAANQHKQLMERAMETGEQLRERLATPAQKLAKSLADINYLAHVGAINPYEAARARQEATQLAVKDIKIEAPKSMEVGSAEAYKYLTQGKNDKVEQQIKLAQEQKLLAQAQVDATRIMNQKLDKLAEVSPRRAS